MKILFFLAATIAILGAFEIEGGYEIPPSAQTYGNAPVISDEMMKECVKIYNKALTIERTLNPNHVNRYSSDEVNLYNQNVRMHSQLIDWFNANCAGKQSYSACKAAQELNRQRGLPEQSCGY